MRHCIDAHKANTPSFVVTPTIKSASNDSPVKHWRAKYVGFRDYLCDTMLSLDASLVEDAGPLRAQLNALRAEAGSDEPESLLDGLYRVETLPAMDKRSDPPDPCQWRCQIQAARVVVAFTDFSPHPVMPQPTGDTEAEAINSIHANRIFLSLFAPEMECHQTLGESNEQDYSAIAFDTNSPAGPQDALVAFTREKTNFKEALAALAKTRSMSSHTEVL